MWAFHPIHVFLNTNRPSTYENAKKHFKNWEKLKNLKNTCELGVENYLRSMLEAHSDKKFDLFRDVKVAKTTQPIA